MKKCARGPIANAKSRVPTPTVPPNHHPCGQHGQFEACANHPDGVAAGRQTGHQAVPRPWPEPGADVQPGGDPVTDHAGHQEPDLPGQRLRLAQEGQGDIDHHSYEDRIADGAEPGPLAERDPKQENQQADADDYPAKRDAERRESP